MASTETLGTARSRSRPMTAEEKKVILASSAGTIFEWYDFYLYGSLAAIIGANFFTSFPEATRNVFALLAFAAGFLVRPFGALVFGALGDIVGRKYTFLMTIMIMGLSTFLVGCLPGYSSWGVAAPIILIGLRMLQGLALGGEYGGAAIYRGRTRTRQPARLLHVLHPDNGDIGASALSHRHLDGARLCQRQLSGRTRA
jgi:MFS family permease